LWLHFPGMEPIVDAGVPRQIAIGEQDSYRDNWWCGASIAAEEANKSQNLELPAFLTRAQVATAETEYAALSSLGAAPNYLARQVIEWATKNPADERVPE